MKLHEVETYTATIYVGTSDSLRNSDEYWLGHRLCQTYCDAVGLCVSIKQTRFIYTGGNEYGLEIFLMDYPRFPSDKDTIRRHAIQLATNLKRELKQKRVSVVFPDKTIMLGEMDNG
jgi:hypothetical protein